MSKSPTKDVTVEEKTDLRPFSHLLMGFALLYLLTAFYFSMVNSFQRYELSWEQDTIEFETTKDYETVKFKISKPDIMHRWYYVEADIRDSEGQIVKTFGADLFHDGGFDHSSHRNWEEMRRRAGVQFSFPTAGKYSVQFRVQTAGHQTKQAEFDTFSDLKVTVSRHNGSEVPLTYFGFVLFVVALILYEINNRIITGMFVGGMENVALTYEENIHRYDTFTDPKVRNEPKNKNFFD